jgi:hypothetical protein
MPKTGTEKLIQHIENDLIKKQSKWVDALLIY